MTEKRMILFGCGYVGRALAAQAVISGYKVWVQSRNLDSLAQVTMVPEAHRIGDTLQSTDWHSRLTGRWDLVVNLVSSAGGGLDGYRTSYVEGNRSILKWAKSVDVAKFIYTSATSVYPQWDGSWVAESDVPSPDQLSPSGRILREAELEVLANSSIARTLILRLGGIYGPGRHLYLDRLLSEGEGVLPGDGSTYLNLIHLEDIVRAILHLDGDLELPERHVFNLVDDMPAKKQEIVDWLARRIRAKTMRFDPAVTGTRASRRGAGGHLPNRRISNSSIKEMTGWIPRYPDYQKGYEAILDKRRLKKLNQ